MTDAVQTHPLISIRSNASVQEAARLMVDCGMSALGVLGADRSLIGIVTERDLAAFVSQGGDPALTTAGSIANDFPVIVDGPVSDAEALDRMRTAHIRHLLVNQNGRVEIVSMRDFVMRRSEQ